MNRFAVTLLLITPAAVLAQNRMPPIPAEKLTPEQKKVIELVTAPPRGPIGSTGPFIPLLRSPELMNRLLAVVMNVARSPGQPDSKAPKLAPFPHLGVAGCRRTRKTASRRARLQGPARRGCHGSPRRGAHQHRGPHSG